MSADLDGTAWSIQDAAGLVAELDRDLAERSATYPELVKKGRLHDIEAEHCMTVLGDIREDLRFAFAPIGDGEIRDTYQRDGRVPWQDKVRWIEGELEERRRDFPELVRKGRLSEVEAKRRLGAMKRLHRLYWHQMFQWIPPEGPAREYLAALRSAVLAGTSTKVLANSEGAKLYRATVRAHLVAIAAESGDAQGKLVA